MDILNALLVEEAYLPDGGGAVLVNPCLGWELNFPVDSLKFVVFLQYQMP